MTMSKTTYITDLHRIHIEWNALLDLSIDELKSFEIRLQEIVQGNSSKETLAQVEHFQNQFIRQRELIDELRHDIQEDELRVAKNAKENNVAVIHRRLEINSALTERMSIYKKIVDEMKIEY
ncbi:MAG: hypothetical protein RIT07_1863, partial [Bacteroidota bacterium]